MTINELGKKYGLNSEEDVWAVRPGIYAMKHDAVMKIADKEGIVFDKPDVYPQEDGGVSMVGTAHLGQDGGFRTNQTPETIHGWATGEANSSNCTNKYYWAMAEKRLKDRLTLKIIKAYEYGIYSEVEADAFEKKDNK